MASGSVGADEGRDDLSHEDLFDALAHERRRHLLDVLDEAGAALSLSDLARSVARQERASPRPVDDGTVKRVRLSLYHWHVPKLEDAGLVEFDPDARTVGLAVRVAAIPDWADLLRRSG